VNDVLRIVPSVCGTADVNALNSSWPAVLIWTYLSPLPGSTTCIGVAALAVAVHPPWPERFVPAV
jgi:hypothetical protein